jgi:hypothetical protein
MHQIPPRHPPRTSVIRHSLESDESEPRNRKVHRQVNSKCDSPGGKTVRQDESPVSGLGLTATCDEAEGRLGGPGRIGALPNHTPGSCFCTGSGIATAPGWDMRVRPSNLAARVPPQVAFAGIVAEWPLPSSRLRSYGVERKPAPATQRPASAPPLRKLPPATSVTV